MKLISVWYSDMRIIKQLNYGFLQDHKLFFSNLKKRHFFIPLIYVTDQLNNFISLNSIFYIDFDFNIKIHSVIDVQYTEIFNILSLQIRVLR